MKTTLLVALFGIISTFSFGQINLTIEGNPYISGTTYEITADTSDLIINGRVINNTGAPLDLIITRVIENPLPSWKDDLCWGSTSGLTIGQCYNAIQATNPYTTPDIQTVNDGDEGLFQAKIKPKNPYYGCSEYKYYIKEGATIFDSIQILVCKNVSVEELTPALSITVAPNPASSYFTVKANSEDGATIQVVDVLGNVVLKETLMGSSKTINTESFRNGVYFVRVEAENQRPINRKVIVRH